MATFDSPFFQVGSPVPPLVGAILAGRILAEFAVERAGCPDADSDVTEPGGTSFSRLIPGIKSGVLNL